MRILVAAALVVLALAGCASESDRSRVERCTDRLLNRVQVPAKSVESVRRYARVTYCGPFASRGWVYDDGALSIAAHRWLEGSGSEVCGTAREDGQSETVPCEQLEPPKGDRVIDCAMLRHVRRSQVRTYLAKLRDDVECDDGTRVELLGVP